MRKEFNVLIGKRKEDLEDWELELFLGMDLKDDGVPFVYYEKMEKYPQLLKDLGIFSSNSEARKNGWDKEIPMGFEDIEIGKLHNRLTTYKR